MQVEAVEANGTGFSGRIQAVRGSKAGIASWGAVPRTTRASPRWSPWSPAAGAGGGLRVR